jgi:hypothetical protein
MLVPPCELVELIEAAGNVANCFSSGSATADAWAGARHMRSPGWWEVHRQQVADRQLLLGHHPKHDDAQHDERRDGALMKIADRFMAPPPLPGPGLTLMRARGVELTVGDDRLPTLSPCFTTCRRRARATMTVRAPRSDPVSR